MNCLEDDADLFIIIWQDVSNFGEKYHDFYFSNFSNFKKPIYDFKYEPNLNISGAENETNKRNKGLEIAKYHNCSHFLHIDCDEYYENFRGSKQKFLNSGAKGSVCKILTYFKKPTLRLENEDNYYVPFIHELKTGTIAGNQDYPFYVDPTRKINESNIFLLDVYMHHFSWIRKDIERKVRNSSAKANIERSNLLKDYYSNDTKAGTFLVDYDQKLIDVENIFGIEI